MRNKLNIAFFGSSLLSSYWNGAATYYRGIISALAQRGHQISFYEPDAFDRQKNRDISEPDWARVIVYGNSLGEIEKALHQARSADILIKASGVGVFDEWLEEQVIHARQANQKVIFWDVDAPATLDRMHKNPKDTFRQWVPHYDLILSYGGGEPVVEAYLELGANDCIPVYNALDPSTHFPVNPQKTLRCDLAFMGNRLPDREKRVELFFLDVAARLPQQQFVLGGSGWQDKNLSPNIHYLGHVPTHQHNAINSSAKAILNISRQSMADYGFSPATRVFEAAGAEACLISDYWKGIELFLEPGQEILVAKNGQEVEGHLSSLSPERATRIGKAALERVLGEHTYAHRARQLEQILENIPDRKTHPNLKYHISHS